MKRTVLWSVLGAALLGVAFSGKGPMGGEEWGEGKSLTPLGFGQKVAGPWITTSDFGNGPFEGVMLVTADGGVVVNNTQLINADGSTSHLTAAAGGWKRIGRQTVAVTFLIRIVESTGALKFYEKVVGEAEIDGDVMTGDAMGLVYLPGQDPLDPAETPVQVLSGPIVARRIPIERLP